MREVGDISYPVAYSTSEQRIIGISDAPRERKREYSCAHCDQPMSAVVLVKHKSPHFRHLQAPYCNPDLALHSYAIKMIQQGHAEAQKSRGEYALTRRCESCENYVTEVNLAEGWECDVEKSIVLGTRSDLVFTHSNGRQIVVEVVNTHAMEPKTEVAYQREEVPVAIVNIEWAMVEGLLGELAFNDSRNFNIAICNECELVRQRNRMNRRLARRIRF